MVGRLAPLLVRARPADGDLEGAYGDRQRRTQLVGSVGGEGVQAAEAPLQSIEQAVQDPHHLVELVAVGRQLDPAIEVVDRHLARGPHDVLDRPQRPARQPHGDGDGERQRDRCGHGEGEKEEAGGVVIRLRHDVDADLVLEVDGEPRDRREDEQGEEGGRGDQAGQLAAQSLPRPVHPAPPAVSR